MDKVRERRDSRLLPWAFVLLLPVLAYGGYRVHRSLSIPVVDLASLQLATVVRTTFEDVINVRGAVSPGRSVILSAGLGGQLEKIHVEEGDVVEVGQPLFEIGNSELQLDVIARQTDLSTQMNILRQNELSATQRVLQLERDSLQVQEELGAVEKRIERSTQLGETGALPQEIVDDLERTRAKLKAEERLLGDAIVRIREQNRQQAEELARTIVILRNNLELAQTIIEKLFIRAPIAGRITDLTPEVGSTLQRGDEIARIEDESRLKIEAAVDEFHIARVRAGLTATVSYDNRTYNLRIDRVYPKVSNGQFRVDLEFSDDTGVDLRIGQGLTVRLMLGEGRETLVLPVGPYMSGGSEGYVYVVSGDADGAERRSVRFGRMNSSFVEVIEGLAANEAVIVSQYTDFIDSPKIAIRTR